MTGHGQDHDLPGAHNYTFTTKRLFFRPLRLDDVPHVFAFRSDPKVFSWKTPETHESQSREWVLARLKSKCFLTFCVEELSARQDWPSTTEGPPVVGMCGGTTLPELGYMFRPSVWGRGYATEALEGFIGWYWTTFPNGHPTLEGEDRIYLRAVTGPLSEAGASIAVLKKCGFEYWKEQEEDDIFGKGKVLLPVWRRWKNRSI